MRFSYWQWNSKFDSHVLNRFRFSNHLYFGMCSWAYQEQSAKKLLLLLKWQSFTNLWLMSKSISMIQERGEMLTRSYLDLCYCVHKINVPHGFEIGSQLSHECHNDWRPFLRFISGSSYEFHSNPIDDLAYQISAYLWHTLDNLCRIWWQKWRKGKKRKTPVARYRHECKPVCLMLIAVVRDATW